MHRSVNQGNKGMVGLTKVQTWGMLSKEWLAFLDKHRSPAHAGASRRISARLSVFNKVPWDQITKQMVMAHIDSLGVTNCVTNSFIGNMTHCFNYHLGLGVIDRNPLDKLPRLPHDPKTPYVPSEKDINTLLSHVSPESPEKALLCDFALETGLRIGEVVDTRLRPLDKVLRWEDCHLQGDKPTVRLWTKKSGRSTWVEADMPISRSMAVRLMERKLQSKGEHVFPWTYSSLKRWLKRSCISAGIKPFGWHSFRHFFAHYLAEQDIPTRQIQLGLRHKSIAITERYLQGIMPSHDLVNYTFQRRGVL
jgi:integrase